MTELYEAVLESLESMLDFSLELVSWALGWGPKK